MECDKCGFNETVEQLHSVRLERMLKRINFQYGELSNKYAKLKYELERLKPSQKTGEKKNG